MAKRHAEEHGEKVPIWVISFADMITLLLSFFVMLQTMAHSQDATLFGISQESFRRAISGFGIPDFLFGKQSGPQYDYRKLKYPTEEAQPDDPKRSRVIDADDDRIREIFHEMQQQMQTEVSNSAEELINVFVTPIQFKGGSAVLDEQGRGYLRDLAVSLRQNLASRRLRLQVVGLARGGESRKEDYLLSARRAAAAEEFLRAQVSSQQDLWTVQSWAGGSSDAWARKYGADAAHQVLVVVIGVKETGG